MSKPARMEADRERLLSAEEESEAGIGADVLAGDRRAAAGYGPYPLPYENGFYLNTLTFNQTRQNEILRFAQDDSRSVIFELIKKIIMKGYIND